MKAHCDCRDQEDNECPDKATLFLETRGWESRQSKVKYSCNNCVGHLLGDVELIRIGRIEQ